MHRPKMILFTIAIAAFVVLLSHSAIAQDTSRKLVGFSQSKVLFAIYIKSDWDYVTNYCHNWKMMSASIDSELENELVAMFLNTTSDIDSFWLPATDYITEGTFAWIRTKVPFTYSNWGQGYPSINRTRNCVIIRKDGTWAEELCVSDTVAHHGLCELPLFTWADETRMTTVVQAPQHASRDSHQPISLKEIPGAARIVPIGGVGTTLYFKDDTLTPRKLYQALDFCHTIGMRLVSPDTPEEYEFLSSYSRQLSEEFKDPLILTSGSDMLAVGCNKGNAMHRWFYSDKQVELDGEFIRYWWYQCITITPVGFVTPSCIGFPAWTLCELNTAIVM